MSSFLSKALHKGVHPARENDGAIEAGLQASQTEGTLDPEQQKTNDAFEAEIQQLEASQNASQNTDGNSEGGAGGAGGGAPEAGDPADAAGAKGSEGEAGQGNEGGTGGESGEGGEATPPAEVPKDATATEEEKGEADQAVEQEVANGEGSAPADPEDAAQGDTAHPKVEKALEALAAVANHLQVLRDAHNTGVIRPLHMAIARENMNVHARHLKVQGVSFARESSIVSNVMEFIARLLKGIRDFVLNIFKWIADVLRGWQARKGVYSKDEAGVKDRIKALKDTKADVKSNEKGETISIPKLSNWHASDIQGVMKAVQDLDKIQHVALQNIANQPLADVFHGIIAATMHGLSVKQGTIEEAVKGLMPQMPVIDDKVVFGRLGVATGFGNDPFFRDSVTTGKGTVSNTQIIAVQNLIGGNVLRWTLQRETTDNLGDYAASMRGIDCVLASAAPTRSARGTGDIQLLLTIEEIEQTIAYRAVLEKRASDLLDLSKRTTVFSKKLSDLSATGVKTLEQVAKIPNIDAPTVANLGVLFGGAPEAYNRLATSSLAKISSVLMGVCDGLNTLVKASMAAIDKKMGTKADAEQAKQLQAT